VRVIRCIGDERDSMLVCGGFRFAVDVMGVRSCLFLRMFQKFSSAEGMTSASVVFLCVAYLVMHK
jgi:hypothetical protein